MPSTLLVSPRPVPVMNLRLPENTKLGLKDHPEGGSVDEVWSAYRLSKADGQTASSFLAALRGARLSFPDKHGPPKPINVELERRRAYLRRREEDRAYGRLTEGVCSKQGKRSEVGQLIPNLSIGANVLFAMATGFIVSYVAASSLFERVEHRMAAGCAGFTLMLLVEIALFVIKEHKRQS